LLAIYVAIINSPPKENINIHTDSDISLKGILKINNRVSNIELYDLIDKVINERLGNTRFWKIKAHSGLHDGNSVADDLANKMRIPNRSDLVTDNLFTNSGLKNTLDASVNYIAHNISYNFWNNLLTISQKKFYMQLHSGELMEKDWLSPTKCTFCRIAQSFKHCFLECRSINPTILLATKDTIRNLLNTNLSQNPIELAWEDRLGFNQHWYVSPRGIASVKLGDFIIENSLEEKWKSVQVILINLVSMLRS